MALEDYTKSNSPKKIKKSPKHSQTTLIGSMLLSALIGFGGGLFAIRFSPDIIAPTDQITEKVVVAEGEIIADLVERVGPSVVSINVTSVTETFNPFFGSRSREASGSGTGIILSEDGLLVTNDHVIPENVTEVEVTLKDGTVYDNVSVIGREPFNDIAYLQIDNVSGLQPAVLGDSESVRVGQQVIAIGNALGEFDTTVTSGIISGEGRPIVAGVGSDTELLTNLFQTDASINPGNSGGPLLNINGEVIAINTAVAGNAENIGFAIPINDVKPGITSVETNGELIRPYLGVRYITLTAGIAEELELETTTGALIRENEPGDAIIGGSPAEKAGLTNGDIITQVNGKDVNEDKPLPNVIGQYQVGAKINRCNLVS